VKEKLYAIPIDHPLTPKKRKIINDYIARNTHLAPADSSHDWDRETPHLLRIKATPAEFEIFFHEKNVEIHGSAPFWARLLFTQEKRTQLKEQIELLLHDTGFIDTKPKGVRPARLVKKAG
jgi:hypothetical protein